MHGNANKKTIKTLHNDIDVGTDDKCAYIAVKIRTPIIIGVDGVSVTRECPQFLIAYTDRSCSGYRLHPVYGRGPRQYVYASATIVIIV